MKALFRFLCSTLFVCCLTTMLLMLLVAPAFAQGVDPSLPSLPVLDLSNLASLLLQLRDVVLLGFVSSVPTTLIVAFLKRFDLFREVAAERMAWIIGTALFAILLVSMLAGYEVQFRSLLSVVVGILAVLTGPGAAFLGAAGIYQVSKALNAPVLGYQRTDPHELVEVFDPIRQHTQMVPVVNSVKWGKADNNNAA